MPNYCAYDLKVTGKIKENVDKFVDWLQCDYHYISKDGKFMPKDVNKIIAGSRFHYSNDKYDIYLTAEKHFYRVFESYKYEEGKEGDYYTAYVSGDCAWSVHSCMLSGAYTYFSECPTDAELAATCLENATKELGVKVEVFSWEPGMEFSEHYIVKDGEILCEESEDYCERYWDEGEYETFEEFKEANGVPDEVTEDNVEDGYVKWGGFSPDFEKEE